jgi:alkylhydroperoxidase family enzyme
MTRLPLIERTDLAPREQYIFDRLERERPSPTPHVFKVLANAPNLLDKFLNMANELREGTSLDPRVRELAILMTARTLRAHYEFDKHWNLAICVGVSRKKLEPMRDFDGDFDFSSGVYRDVERAVLRLAHDVTASVQVSESVWGEAARFYAPRRLTELLLTIGWYNLVARVMEPAELQGEEWFRLL